MPGPDPLPILGCEHVDDVDGTCHHPKNITPECHVFICPRISPVVQKVAELAHDLVRGRASRAELSDAVENLGGR